MRQNLQRVIALLRDSCKGWYHESVDSYFAIVELRTLELKLELNLNNVKGILNRKIIEPIMPE